MTLLIMLAQQKKNKKHMKHIILAPIIFIFLSPINAEDNPFATKPRYGHDPFYKESISKKILTDSEVVALSALCRIGLKADGGIWKNDDINAAIASIKWGRNWVDTAQVTAYKTCNYKGYLD